MKLYDNGEEITKDRIQDEEWYPDYQSTLEAIVFGDETDVLTLFEVAKEYALIQDASDEQVLRWCVLHAERKRGILAIRNVKGIR